MKKKKTIKDGEIYKKPLFNDSLKSEEIYGKLFRDNIKLACPKLQQTQNDDHSIPLSVSPYANSKYELLALSPIRKDKEPDTCGMQGDLFEWNTCLFYSFQRKNVTIEENTHAK